MSALLSRRALLGGAAPAAFAGRAPRVRLVDTPGRKVEFLSGARPLFDYCYDAARPKPYVHPLYSPAGTPLTLDGPPDHVHHRGVMIAWSDIAGFDFWGEVNPGPPHGRIVHQRFESMREKPVTSLTAVNHWIGDGEVLLTERRTVRAPAPSAEVTWLEWESELRPAARAVTLSAKDHPYDGLGIRFAHSLDGGAVLNQKGTKTIEAANGQEAEWCAYASVAIFGHPSNPRHPAPFFVMNRPFGYLSAAPTFRTPFELRAGERLTLRYAVAAFAAAPGAEVIERYYRSWSKKPWK